MGVAFSEGAVTRLRREFKLLLDHDAARGLCGQLLQIAEPTCTRITSVYFDGPGQTLAQRAQRTPHDCVKLRTKEYFPDVGADGARVVLEAKREKNGLTQKERVWVRRSELGSLFASGALWQRLPAHAVPELPALMPTVAVSYVRQVFQYDASWRVTVDRDVAFHTIRSALALGRRRVHPELLDAPYSREPRVVVEVKHLGEELPEWLGALGEQAATRFSKFAEGIGRLGLAQVDGAFGG